jgi:hypothetical protein
MSRARLGSLLPLLALAGCGGAAPESEADPTPAPVALVSARAWITRVSLDVRGVRPDVADLEAVDAAPEAAAALVEGYLADDRLGTRVAWIWNDALHTAAFFQDPPYRDLLPTDAEARDLGWNALEVVREVVDEDRPFSDIVTAPTVPWNDTLATFWDAEAPGSAEWIQYTPDDGRPMAGMLSIDALWLVYDGDRTNLNRRRANAVSRIFACSDFLARETAFAADIPAESLAVLAEAVRTEPTCIACHAGLDPLASFFGGFADRAVSQPAAELRVYSQWTADWYQASTPAAWYGNPGNDLTDLGAFIAADPRFASCSVRRLAEGLVGHPVDDAQLEAWTRSFVEEDGLQMRPLIARIVASEAYRADEERVLTTEQLHTTLADLTGWDPTTTTAGGWMPLSWDGDMRTLGGGTDDTEVLIRNREVGLGSHVLMTWAGRVAAGALAEDAARPAGERVLWTVLDPAATDLTEDDVRVQLATWASRFLSEPVAADDPRVDGLLALWEGAGDTPADGGAVVLQALVRHPASRIY